MTGSRPLSPSIADVRVLLGGARELAGPVGAALELCLLCLALPWEVVAIQLEAIDRPLGSVEVPARGGRTRTLILPPAALRTIHRVAGDAGGKGQAVTAGRGPRLVEASLRLDRLQARLAQDAPETIGVGPWNFHGVRAAAAKALTAAGAAPEVVHAALGLHRREGRAVPRPGVGGAEDVGSRAAAALAAWNAMLAGKADR